MTSTTYDFVIVGGSGAPVAARSVWAVRGPAVWLALRVRARAVVAVAAPATSARQGAGWVQQYQRDAVSAGEPSGFRSVGRGVRDAGVGLRALSALLPAVGELSRRGGRFPWSGGAAHAGEGGSGRADLRCVLRGCGAGRLCGAAGHQRWGAGGFRAVGSGRSAGSAGVGGA